MNGSKIVGILILVLLVLSLVIVSVGAALSNTSNNNQVNYKLTFKDDQLDSLVANSTDYSEYGTENVTDVNINIKQKTGGVRILFAKNTNNVYNITGVKDKDSRTTVTNSVNGSTLNVNIDSKNTETIIVLSNKYRYNITGDMTTGGLQGDLDNSRIGSLNYNIVMGGINLNITNTTHLDKFNSNITLGGVNIEGNGQFGTAMNVNVDIGGINVNSVNPVVLAKVNVNLGGANGADGYTTVSNGSYTEIKGTQYDSVSNKMTINSNIEIGGLSLN